MRGDCLGFKAYLFCLLFCLLFFFSVVSSQTGGPLDQHAHASEADYFTHHKPLKDATPWLNNTMNFHLIKAARSSSSCEKQELFDLLIADLGGFGYATIEYWVDDLPQGYKYQTSPPQSIYRNLLWDTQIVAGCCDPVIFAADSYISSDKLGHFFHSGYEMYLYSNQNQIEDGRMFLARWLDRLENIATTKTGLAAVMDIGDQQEHSTWGYKTTGIYSYADLAANYEGYLFWGQLVDGDRPYFKCTKTKGSPQPRWELVREFNWKEYISDAWDETVNCNKYRTERMQRWTNKNILSLNNPKLNACARQSSRCPDLWNRYGEWSPSLLNCTP